MPVKYKSKRFRDIWLGKDGRRYMRVNYHDGQRRADQSKARYVVMMAGTQGGKTCYGPHWLHDQIMQTKVKGDQNDYLAVTATFPLLKMNMEKQFREVFENLLQLGVYKESQKLFLSHEKYHGAELWRVIICSASNPESIESATAKAAWLDEAGQVQFRREAWEAVERRLNIYEGRVLITTTLYCLGWLKTDIYDKWVAGDKDIDVITFDSRVNPSFPLKSYEKAKATLPPWKFKMFYQGLYDRPAGVVYDCFDPAASKVPRFIIPNNWLIHVGHDFGTANPAALFVAQDPATGLLYPFEEYRPQVGTSVAQQVADFKRITQGKTVVKRVGGSHQEEGWRGDYTAHGWPIHEPKVNKVDVQIGRVYALHKLNKILPFSDLERYLDEKASFSYKLDDESNPTDEIEEGALFHLMACERYILSEFTPETVVTGEEGQVWKY